MARLTLDRVGEALASFPRTVERKREAATAGLPHAESSWTNNRGCPSWGSPDCDSPIALDRISPHLSRPVLQRFGRCAGRMTSAPERSAMVREI